MFVSLLKLSEISFLVITKIPEVFANTPVSKQSLRGSPKMSAFVHVVHNKHRKNSNNTFPLTAAR